MTEERVKFSDVVGCARQSLTKPEYFYNYDEDLFVTHGYSGFAQHRDSDVLQRANWESILKICNEHEEWEENEDWYVNRSSHFLVGWVDNLVVRVIKADSFVRELDDLEEEDITDIFKVLLGYYQGVEEVYPIIDENLFCEMEAEEELTTLENCSISAMIKCPPTEHGNPDLRLVAEEIRGWLWDNGIESSDYSWSEDEVRLAAFHLGRIETEEYWWEDWEEWLSEQTIQPGLAEDFVAWFKEVEFEKAHENHEVFFNRDEYWEGQR